MFLSQKLTICYYFPFFVSSSFIVSFTVHIELLTLTSAVNFNINIITFPLLSRFFYLTVTIIFNTGFVTFFCYVMRFIAPKKFHLKMKYRTHAVPLFALLQYVLLFHVETTFIIASAWERPEKANEWKRFFWSVMKYLVLKGN